ncbi:MAG: hypothetical protein M3169_16395 [Candidatus Eremiobacteraeota bacterium]|nr:hypothetical protein [Candidatus Eremiobacteraeota bacterium]
MLGAIAGWPGVVDPRVAGADVAVLQTPAPVLQDYLQRDRLVAFWEKAVRQHLRQDMLSPQNLAGQYLQRFREQGNVDDVLRARAAAELSLRAQPRGNIPAMAQLAAAHLALHDFKKALEITRAIERLDPGDPAMEVREASLDLELGREASAKRILDKLPRTGRVDIAADTLRARYLEETGHLAEARETFARTAAFVESLAYESAERRAWFAMRSGELAFEAGDNQRAIDDETRALEVFPRYVEGFRLRARFECALARWEACRDDAMASANIIPYPETLGYAYDAERALGETEKARQTRDLIDAIYRLTGTQRISDGLLASYYSEHRIHVHEAYAIALRELTVRDDIYTQDRLAWAAAMDGRWHEARANIRKALRFDTENAILQYHAGVIALHFGERSKAMSRLRRALSLNPQFHGFYAQDARLKLAALFGRQQSPLPRRAAATGI